jgi:UDP-N-acetylmuramate--alanine ligase
MKDLDLTKVNNVHFIGIGGIGISAIARMMLKEGKHVNGQDLNNSEIVKELVKEGADVKIGQLYENIPENTDLIVYTIAIESYDPDLFEKLKSQKNIPIRSYPEMLGLVSEGKYTIAISGTHGKTTTTGMIAQILRDAGKDPTVIIGSLLVGDKSNFIAGKSEYFA